MQSRNESIYKWVEFYRLHCQREAFWNCSTGGFLLLIEMTNRYLTSVFLFHIKPNIPTPMKHFPTPLHHIVYIRPSIKQHDTCLMVNTCKKSQNNYSTNNAGHIIIILASMYNSRAKSNISYMLSVGNQKLKIIGHALCLW